MNLHMDGQAFRIVAASSASPVRRAGISLLRSILRQSEQGSRVQRMVLTASSIPLRWMRVSKSVSKSVSPGTVWLRSSCQMS